MANFKAKSRVPRLHPSSDTGPSAPSVLASAISGTVGSLITEAGLFPLDTIKLRVQTQPADDAIGWASMVIKIYGELGISGFYKGIRGSLLKEAWHSMNFWLIHGLLFSFTKSHDNSKTPGMRRLLLNLFAKQLNWLCTLPFEVVANLNQLSGKGFLLTAHELYTQHGISPFYRGLGISLALSINPAIMYTLVTWFLRIITACKRWWNPSAAEGRRRDIFWATAFAKLIATMLTYPLIRAKVLQQTQPGPRVSLVFGAILATEGFTGLYRGFLAMTYRTVLWNSMMMYLKHILVPRAPTPPGTPSTTPEHGPEAAPLPLFNRDPFPADLLTASKMDQIVTHLRHNPKIEKIESLETKVRCLSSDLQEIKSLLHHALVPKSPNSEGKSVSFAPKVDLSIEVNDDAENEDASSLHRQLFQDKDDSLFPVLGSV